MFGRFHSIAMFSISMIRIQVGKVHTTVNVYQLRNNGRALDEWLLTRKQCVAPMYLKHGHLTIIVTSLHAWNTLISLTNEFNPSQ